MILPCCRYTKYTWFADYINSDSGLETVGSERAREFDFLSRCWKDHIRSYADENIGWSNVLDVFHRYGWVKISK